MIWPTLVISSFCEVLKMPPGFHSHRLSSPSSRTSLVSEPAVQWEGGLHICPAPCTEAEAQTGYWACPKWHSQLDLGSEPGLQASSRCVVNSFCKGSPQGEKGEYDMSPCQKHVQRSEDTQLASWVSGCFLPWWPLSRQSLKATRWKAEFGSFCFGLMGRTVGEVATEGTKGSDKLDLPNASLSWSLPVHTSCASVTALWVRTVNSTLQLKKLSIRDLKLHFFVYHGAVHRRIEFRYSFSFVDII